MGRNKNNHETDRLTFQVPKEIKDYLYKLLKPLVKREVKKFKKSNTNN